jgi:hypothetical protein
MKFIYALNEEDRKFLIAKGYEELFSCRINGNKAYAFDNNLPSTYATFTKEDKKKFLISDVAMFI